MEKKFIYTNNYRNIEKTICQKKIKNENKIITCCVNIPLRSYLWYSSTIYFTF